MRLRTAVILNDYAHINGGAAKVAIESACGLAQAGWRVHFFAAVGPIEPRLIESKVNVTLTNQTDLANQTPTQAIGVGLWNQHAAKRLAMLLNGLPAGETVIHLHGWIKALTGSVVRVSIDSGHPVTMTLHDYFLSCPNGGLFDFQKGKSCELKPMSLSCMTTHCDKRGMHHKMWRVGRHLRNQLAGIPSEMRSFIAVSEYSRKLLAPSLPEHASIELIPNPISVIKQPSANPSQSRHLLFIGRLEPEKGCVMLAQVCREIGFPIRFAGIGPESVKIQEVNPDAALLGWMNGEDVIRELRSARALVLSSLWHETQGMVVAEAAAHGIPSVVPDRCAAADMVNNQVNGLIFRSGNNDSLKETLNQLRDDNLVSRLGDQADSSFWEDPPTLDAHISRLTSYYESLLTPSRSYSVPLRLEAEEESQYVG